MHLLYIFGDPGIGKSTMVSALVGGLLYECRHRPFMHMVYACGVMELGSDRQHFRGTDGLALDVQPQVVSLLDKQRPPLVLAEGDRLANSRFFSAVRGMGYKLWPVYLTGKTLASERRKHRAEELSISLQNAQWVAGRNSKNRRLADDWDALEIHPVLPAHILIKLLPGPVAAAFDSAAKDR
jgi:hypothetical protein